MLENGEYQRASETQRRVSSARVVTATNRDLRRKSAATASAPTFTTASACSRDVPPLRDMDEDRSLLLDHFRKFYAR